MFDAPMAHMIAHEGYEQVVYADDKGHATVGVGHRVIDADNLKIGDIISRSRIRELFLNDLEAAESGARTTVSNWTELPGTVRHALIDMTFQMGTRGVKRFHRTLAHIEAGNYSKAAAEVLRSRWGRRYPNRSSHVAYLINLGTTHATNDTDEEDSS